jgi:WD40 repeat protein
VKLWQVHAGGSLTELDEATVNRRAVDGTPVAFNSDSQTLAFVDVRAGIRLWAVGTRGSASTINATNGKVLSLAFSPDGKILVLGNESGIISLWHVERKRLLGESLSCAGQVNSVAFSSDGSKLAAGGTTMHVWEVPSDIAQRWPPPKRFRPPSEIYHVAFAPDSRHVATGNKDGTVYVFRLSGREAPLPKDVKSPTEEQ